MAACPDARIVISPGVLRGLVQLPDGWMTGEVRVLADGGLEIDAVFPDGPSDLPAVTLVPHYRRIYHSDGKAVTLDHIGVAFATPDRPRRRGLFR